ncbi:hypothetical protein KP509_22G056700 [Ceratopteris richardii]|uniref:Uncharacterized protein n=2 Tax=Ceratopteris richardii TaxID=49495 RepID=A0A8T2S5F6_CERRI|nr:hypothetical protein KP509_22G056700 [Ceratopteris richardii]
MSPILRICILFVLFWNDKCINSSASLRGVPEWDLLFQKKSNQHQSFSGSPPIHPPRPGISNPLPPGGLSKSPSSKLPPSNSEHTPLAVVDSDAAFTLYHGRNFKVIQNLIFNFSYLLIQQGGDPGARDWNVNISVFQDPLVNFTLNTNSVVGFLELLGCASKLRGVPATFGSASTCVSQLIVQGTIPTFELEGDLFDHDSSTAKPAFQALLGSSNEESNLQNQSNFISFDAWSDRGPLQRAEWIKFLASFFDMEERANDVYNKIQSNYQCLNASSKGINISKPSVAWMTYSMASGIWTFSKESFKLQLISDAGGLNLDSYNMPSYFNMSIQSDVDVFHSVISSLDVVIDETHSTDPSEYTLDNVLASANITDSSNFSFLANKRLWRYDKRVGINNALDWTEGALAQPQIVLHDLIEVLYPSPDGGILDITYFRNIANGESVVNSTLAACPRTDLTSPVEPLIIPCTSE